MAHYELALVTEKVLEKGFDLRMLRIVRVEQVDLF
jgi:hypothetical protein